MKKRSALIFGLLAAVLALGMAVTGCDNGSGGDDGGSAKFPAAWAYMDINSKWINTVNVYVTFTNIVTPAQLCFVNTLSSYSDYNLKTFTGDGSGTGSFTIKQLNTTYNYEIGEVITVQYAKEGDTITLTSTDIEAWESGMAFTKEE